MACRALYTLALLLMAASSASAAAAAADACAPEALPARTAGPPRLPPLAPGVRPNFMVILTDDQGWDDIGLHHASGLLSTPNIDRLIQRGVMFNNYYVTPQCAQSRAALLTGRSFVRTGTMLVHGGYDFINSAEATAGNVMKDAGYDTAHFGKWHNADVAGYEPWFTGFDESFSAPGMNAGPARHNGLYINSTGVGEEALLSNILDYLRPVRTPAHPQRPPAASSGPRPARARAARAEPRPRRRRPPRAPPQRAAAAAAGELHTPFFAYWAPNAIHFARENAHGTRVRVYPAEYRALYNGPKYAGIAQGTLDTWGMISYLDAVLGQFFDFLDANPALAATTYVLLSSDNGPALLGDEERGAARLTRMPSGAQGVKHSLGEGGILNFMAVTGPGVPAGAVDGTLLDVTDVLPTVAALAGIPANGTDHLPWDGLSFANLLIDAGAGTAGAGTAAAAAARPASHARLAAAAQSLPAPAQQQQPQQQARGDGDAATAARAALATSAQRDRMLFKLSPHCWDADAVPVLGPDREIVRPQPLLDYDTGGVPNVVYAAMLPGLRRHNPGFEPCIAVRYKDWKWLGSTNKVYRLAGGSHIELSCNEVPEPRATELRALMRGAAREWWASVVAEPHSFTKPTFYLGLSNTSVTNILASGAHERTPGSVKLFQNGAEGFRAPGDRACFSTQVMEHGRYEVTLIYVSNHNATVRFSVGTFADIASGAAPSITGELPAQRDVMAGVTFGKLDLHASRTRMTEACIELVKNSSPDNAPVFRALAVIRMARKASPEDRAAAAAAVDAVSMDALPRRVTTEAVRGKLIARKYNSMAGVLEAQTQRERTRVQAADAHARAAAPARAVHTRPAAARAPAADAAAPPADDRVAAALRLEAGALQRAHRRPAVGARREAALSAADLPALAAQYRWPAGQGGPLESMWSPYHSEGIDACDACRPPV
ncbi:hypothetical protein HT031_005537 [Scenedesmus sp. PABB004]|nr:hypothetical protein HT031_005537 [Scenedesmus sp. PABB004]